MLRQQRLSNLPKVTVNDKLRVGDMVIIIAGGSKGQTGVLKKKIRTQNGLRYIVEDCNIKTKHQKPNPQAGIPGSIQKIEGSIHSSNIAIFNPQTGKADKVKFSIEDGVKIRLYKTTSAVIQLSATNKAEG